MLMLVMLVMLLLLLLLPTARSAVGSQPEQPRGVCNRERRVWCDDCSRCPGRLPKRLVPIRLVPQGSTRDETLHSGACDTCTGASQLLHLAADLDEFYFTPLRTCIEKADIAAFMCSCKCYHY